MRRIDLRSSFGADEDYNEKRCATVDLGGSFAQLEREVASERIRDKIAASRPKGKVRVLEEEFDSAGGTGADRFTGGTASDTINARASDVDTSITCGESTNDSDVVNADTADPVNANCEVVNRP